MHQYFVYGMVIDSELPLSQCCTRRAPVDVVVRKDDIDFEILRGGTKGSWFHVTSREACFIWEKVGSFLIRKGRDLIFDPVHEIDEPFLVHVVLGLGVSFLLQQRGLLPLHASVSALRGKTIAIAGESGKGKSTLAGIFHSRGLDFVSDDIAAVDTCKGHPFVLPGFPSIKLRPDTVASLGDMPDRLPRIHAGSDKRLKTITDGFCRSPLPLQEIYFLSDGRATSIEAISPQEGFCELVRHTHHSQFILPAFGAHAHMRICASVANCVDFYRVYTDGSFSSLSRIADMILECSPVANPRITNAPNNAFDLQ